MANITLEGMLDGADKAGAIVRAGSRYDTASPSELVGLGENCLNDSTADHAADALVGARVDIYLRAHPEYWRRLRAQLVGVDIAWGPTEQGCLHH